MKIYKIAYTLEQNRSKIESVEEIVKESKKDIKELKSDLSKLEKRLDDLNIGNRKIWQQQNIFSAIQRKLERFEALEKEWKKYKEDFDKESE